MRNIRVSPTYSLIVTKRSHNERTTKGDEEMTNPELDAYEKCPADYMVNITKRDDALETSVYLMRNYRLRIAELEAETKRLQLVIDDLNQLVEAAYEKD